MGEWYEWVVQSNAKGPPRLELLCQLSHGRRVVGKTPSFTARMLRGVVVKLALCVVLAALGLTVVHLTGKLLKSKEPLVSFPATAPAGDEPALPSTESGRQLRFAVATMVSAKETALTYQDLVRRICRNIGYQPGFVKPNSYADVRQKLERGEVDVALVCTGTYVHGLAGGRIELLVQPEFEEGLRYSSLLIVPAGSPAKSMEDLRGKVMAFTDKESNTGYLVPSDLLVGLKHDPRTFFKKVDFTGSHDRSILAVALSLVDGAAVDSLIWESKIRQDPSLVRRVRVIWESDPFGPPPIVVPTTLSQDLKSSLQEEFLALDKDEEGREILKAIGIKRFVRPRKEDYRRDRKSVV